MPVTITPSEARRSFAVLEARSGRALQDAEAAVQALTWRDSDDEPVVVARHTLQRFLWYELPRKWVAPPEDLVAIARALGAFLDEAGASGFAEVCRHPDTERMIRAEAEGWLDLMEASGVEPPDTALLQWSDLMGVEEATRRDDAAVFLEEAIDRGELVPGAPGWRERQAELMERHLTAPGDGGVTPLEAIRAERMEGWLGRPSDGTARRSALAAVAADLGGPAPADDAARLAMEPLLWVLERLEGGIDLTQTGAFARSFVREAVERYPDWWRTDLFGPPYREAEIVPLEALHDIVRSLRLARRRGRRLHATKRARELRGRPTVLLDAIAAGVATSDAPRRGLDLTLALLLHDPPLPRGELHRRLASVLDAADEGGEAERLRELIPHRLLGEAFSVLGPFDGLVSTRDDAPRLTEAGRILATEILRARATGPVCDFW